QVGLAIGETEHDSPQSNEIAKPFEYSVKLDRYNIKTELTPSVHSAIYRFTFPKTDSAHIALDISHHLPDIATIMKGKWAQFQEGSVTFSNADNTELQGYGIYTGGFSDGAYKVYFCARLSKSPAAAGTWFNGKINKDQFSQKSKLVNDRIGAFVQYNTTSQEEIYLKIAVSFKSTDQAATWLNSEIPAWDYAKVKADAKKVWNTELSKITVEGGSEKDKRIFYTAAYHTSIMPRNRTNDAEGFGKDVPVWDDHLAVWDTWRTLYPLKIFTNPEMVSGTVNSFIARLKKNKVVHDAYVALKDKSDDQGGNDIDNIVADAYVKGIKGVNWKEAYALLKHQAENERKGTNYEKSDTRKLYKELGWIPAGKMSSSLTLEYAYNDFCTSQLAKNLGTSEEYKKYYERSTKWINLWNPEAESDGFKGFVTTKKLGGDFIPIDLKKNWGSWQNYFYEGSSWTYSYFVPHQFEKLVQLTGGKQQFAKKLQHGFENHLIDYGNEPAFLAVHSFHYAGRTDLASFYIRKLMKDRFTEDGCIDNDDSGAMSSWYIFSAMGFFPNAGQNIYYLTGSSFPATTIKLANGKTIKIIAENASDENIYIQSCKINGKPWKQFWFTHQDIANGGSIEFVMGATPSTFNK
ncbi:MAG: GH92 family glycosyl hydrolase, partial [Salinivirgaceae bacterium]|nr:GH92 family glycosyl hydrolase [Salinivirgaceae bacterium]